MTDLITSLYCYGNNESASKLLLNIIMYFFRLNQEKETFELEGSQLISVESTLKKELHEIKADLKNAIAAKEGSIGKLQVTISTKSFFMPCFVPHQNGVAHRFK